MNNGRPKIQKVRSSTIEQFYFLAKEKRVQENRVLARLFLLVTEYGFSALLSIKKKRYKSK